MIRRLVHQFSPKLKTTFVGINVEKNVVQFRGIKFGQLSTRWQDPILVSSYTPANSASRFSSHPIPMYDATQYGPIALQPAEDVDGYYAIPKNIRQPMPSSAYQDEFELLNLVITKPENTPKPIPVVIFIHGGSNATGSAANHLYNPTCLVSRSVEIGFPIMVVSLQYRLGALGFLCVDGKGNWGLKDQQLGIEWVEKYISDFGGDTSNISVFGLSAGSCNVYYQTMHHKLKDAFKNVGLMSGVSQTMPLLPLQTQQLITESLHSFAYGSTSLDLKTPESIKKLKQIPSEELIKFGTDQSGIKVWFGTAGDDFFAKNHNISDFDFACASKNTQFLLSDTNHEGLLIEQLAQRIDPNVLKAAIESTSNGKEISKCYGINRALSDSEIQKAVMSLYADYVFCYPIHSFCSNVSKCKDVYRICFDAHNPFNPEVGSQHGVDMLYLFGSYLHPFPNQKMKNKNEIFKLSLEIQDSYIKFFNGSKPWDTKITTKTGQHSLNILHVKPDFKTERLSYLQLERSDIRNIAQFKLIDKLGTTKVGKVVNSILKL